METPAPKKPKRISPTQRSLAYLRAIGYRCAITEHWNAYTQTRQDLFGFIDLTCLKPGEILAVQTTSDANVSARVNKITADPKVAPNALAWLQGGGKIVVHGWAKKGARGERKVWKLREIPITLADFSDFLDSPGSDATQR